MWPYHDHSPSMEDSIAGGMYGMLSILGRHEQRPDREFEVVFAPMGDFQTIDGRAFVGNTPVFTSIVGQTIQWDVMAMGSEHHTFHVHGHRWKSPFGTDVDTQTVGPRRDVPHPLEGGGPRHVAVPLPRRGPHDGRDDRHLPGQAPMRRLGARRSAPTLAALGGAAASRHDGAHARRGGRQAAATVPIQFAAYARRAVDVLAGDTVRWMNDSVRVAHRHLRGRLLGLAALLGDDSFTHRFDTPGTVTYYCMLHPFMRGEVDVHNVLLDGADRARRARPPLRLHGRSALPAGTRREPSRPTAGRASSRPGSATVDADGTFTTEVMPTTTATYRAVVGDEASPAVQLLVLDRKVAATAGGSGRSVHRQRAGRPGLDGAPVVLQLRLPQHFGWWPVARAKLDARLDGALLAAPARTATRRAWSSPCATAPPRWPSAARCTSDRASADRAVIIRRCPRHWPSSLPCWSWPARWPLRWCTRAGPSRHSPPPAEPRCSSRSGR